MSKNRKQKMITPEIMRQAVVGAFTKLDPRYMMKNPVMFVVEIGFVISLVLSFAPGLLGDTTPNARVYNSIVSAILFVTVLFANFAESVAEGRGKAQAASLKKTKKDTQARLLDADGGERMVPSSELKKGDVVMVAAGGVIPGDGEVIEGIASVDESAITGESAPVVREAGGDFSSVTGGTTVVSDWLKVRITSDPGDSFLDRMIALVEGASRKKTPNEIALNTLLVSLTVIFLIVIVTLYPIALYSGVQLQTSTLIALMVCLIPTTIGGLLSAIGIAGMDRVTRFNVIAMSGKAVEACGDVDTMILDKTGTITYGNRLAADFFPVGGACREELVRCAALTSLHDGTPEGKSTLALARLQGEDCGEPQGARFIAFTAQTRMSGVDLPGGRSVRKGASDAIEKYVSEMGGKVPEDLARRVAEVSALGGTPLAVCEDSRILGVIYLKDTVKAGMAERFKRLRAIGIKTIMCTGDNPLTAATIAKEAGVDGFIAECKPEDKIALIKKEQAEGKIVAMTGDGKAVGAKLVGQEFTEAYFMKGRPSAYHYNTYYTDEQGSRFYNDGSEFAGLGSGSNNYAPSNPALTQRVEADIEAFLAENPGVAREDIPADLMTASGSGLDPHISPAAAQVQLPAIAEASGLSPERLAQIVADNTEEKLLGVFGEETVNVPGVNLDIALAMGLISETEK